MIEDCAALVAGYLDNEVLRILRMVSKVWFNVSKCHCRLILTSDSRYLCKNPMFNEGVIREDLDRLRKCKIEMKKITTYGSEDFSRWSAEEFSIVDPDLILRQRTHLTLPRGVKRLEIGCRAIQGIPLSCATVDHVILHGGSDDIRRNPLNLFGLNVRILELTGFDELLDLILPETLEELRIEDTYADDIKICYGGSQVRKLVLWNICYDADLYEYICSIQNLKELHVFLRYTIVKLRAPEGTEIVKVEMDMEKIDGYNIRLPKSVKHFELTAYGFRDDGYSILVVYESRPETFIVNVPNGYEQRIVECGPKEDCIIVKIP